MADKKQVNMTNKTEIKLSVEEYKGIFCSKLYNKLQSGLAAKEFVEGMKKRGFLKDVKVCKEVEQQINFMIHGDRDFFVFCTSLIEKQKVKNDYAKVIDLMKEECKALMADSDTDK